MIGIRCLVHHFIALFDKNSNFDLIFSQSSSEPSKVIELIPHPPINTLYTKYCFIADIIDTWLGALSSLRHVLR